MAELHDLRITLRDAGGAERWSIPNAGVHALVWTPRGELFAAGPEEQGCGRWGYCELATQGEGSVFQASDLDFKSTSQG